jgi:dTDP-L-rhamnose 4-epimerase
MRIVDVARMLARHLSLDIEPNVTGEFRAGDIRHCFADVSRAESALGFRAKVAFEDGIGELVAWASGETPVDRTDEANAELRARALIG